MIEHLALSNEEYRSAFGNVLHSNLLQSFGYGVAKELTGEGRYERYGISVDGRLHAVYQAAVREIPLFGPVARVNRGPLSLNGEPLDEAVWSLLFREWSVRRGALLVIAPALPMENASVASLLVAGFTPLRLPAWHSGYLSLEQDEDGLRKNLKQKWRNLLNKAHKSGLALKPASTGAELDSLLSAYDGFQSSKGFVSVPSTLIQRLAQADPAAVLAFTAIQDGGMAGGCIVAVHGDTATYLVGFTNETGRATNANYALIWQAMLSCKERGVRWFDAGGIDDEGNSGIAHFKRGLGIQEYRLCGEYIAKRGFRGLLKQMLFRWRMGA